MGDAGAWYDPVGDAEDVGLAVLVGVGVGVTVGVGVGDGVGLGEGDAVGVVRTGLGVAVGDICITGDDEPIGTGMAEADECTMTTPWVGWAAGVDGAVVAGDTEADALACGWPRCRTCAAPGALAAPASTTAEAAAAATTPEVAQSQVIRRPGRPRRGRSPRPGRGG